MQTTWFVLANVAIVGLCVAAARRRRADADLWLWVIAGLIAVASGLRFFGHYYLQLLLLLSLLATRPLALHRHGPWPRSRWWSWCPSHTWRCLRTSATTHRPSGPGERSRRDVRAHTPPGAHILVWGHLPEVYWRSDRPPATRFETTGFLTGLSGGRPPSRVGVT